MKTILPAFLLLMSCLSVTSHALSPVEKQLVNSIDQRLERAEAELEQAVEINSDTLNFAGVREVGELFRKQLDDIGFRTQWLDGKAFGRAGHLVADYGTKGKKLLLIGHLDTVFSKDDPFQSLTRLPDNKIAGPGITDMKGGNVIMMQALRALKAAGVLDNLSVKVVLTGDEERSGEPLSASKKAIIDGAKWADIALGFEDGDSNIETAVVARRGSIDWKLEVTGRPAHSSQIFSESIGYGAIFEAARILDGFRQQLSSFGNLTLNPGLALGGTRVEYDQANASANAFGKINVVAQSMQVLGGIRALTPKELTDAQAIMHQIVSDNLKHTSAKLSFGEGYPPMAPTEGNYALLKQYSDASESLGYGVVKAVNPRNAGAADISFAAEHVDMALDGLGLMGSGGHTRDEVADMSSFAKNMHKAALLMYRLSLTE